MKKIIEYPLVLLFAAFIAVFSIVDMFVNRREFSETENRFLAQRPSFSLTALIDGKFSPKYETYINDQFVLRDGWIDLKSKSEYFIGKQENNSIVYGKDGYMFEKYDRPDEERISKNTADTITFLEKYAKKTPISFAIIPNSYMILNDKLPFGLELADQFKLIDKLYADVQTTGAKTLSLKESLLQHKDNYIFYRTDHHWTTYGAYLAYNDYILSRGKTPVDYNTLKGTEVPKFYGTYFSKTKFFKTQPDIVTFFDIPTTSVLIDGKTQLIDADKNTLEITGLYNLPQFEKRDKYAAFLYGNNGLTVIKSENNLNKTEGKTSRILVIKDSYGNSFVPYLTYNYDEVTVLDLRAVPFKISEFMEENSFDDILFIYNFMNFATDTNIARLKY
ncbi:MAG: DHHW family protein [Hydrogenoanaerobacterium sp.]